MAFCDNLKRFRQEAGLKQSEIAEKLDVAQPTYQRWESGLREPSFADIENIAKALNVNVAELFQDGVLDPDPTEVELAGMIAQAMSELPVGLTFEDYPRAVSSSLHEQLKRFRASRGFRRTEA